MRGATTRTRVKICCMQSVDEAQLAIESGADAIGLVSAMPSGPGPIAEEMIAEIAAWARQTGDGRTVQTFLLTCVTDPDSIAAQHARCGTTTIQLCDVLENGAYAKLRAAVPDVALVQVIHVRGEDAVREAKEAAPHVDAILLDSGNPALTVKELGGTGRVHDWALSRRIRDSVDLPVWLAGGLRPDNVARAVDVVEPYGVDVCSGLRPNGQLDPFLLGEFFAALGDDR